MGKPDPSELEERFSRFVKTLEDCEVIDGLHLTREQDGAKRADLFFAKRSIVCEVKSLRTDTREKMDRLLAPYENEPDWPVFYGSWPLAKALSHVPNAQELNARIVQTVSSSVKELIKSANRQIRSTKQAFGLPGSLGLLVILNDLVGVLSPELIGWRVSQELRKRKREGEMAFPHLQAVWLISETHFLDLGPELQALPAVVMINTDRREPVDIQAFLDDLQPRWAEFNGVPYFAIDDESTAGEVLQAMQELPSEPAPTRRHDLWRMAYAHRPYLRPLSKDELFGRGHVLMREWPQLFGVGSTASVDQIQRWMIRFVHWHEEINYRGLDLREFKPEDRDEDWPNPVVDHGEELRPRESRRFEPTVVPGRFYVDPRLGFSYFCEDLSEKLVRWVLVESYQHEKLVQACFTQRIEHTNWYVEIVDDEEIQRLAKIYEAFVARQARKTAK